MHPNHATIDAARIAKVQARRRFARVPGLVGVGLTRQGEGYAIKVNLLEDRRDLIPADVDGVPVVVEVTGQLRPR